MPLLVGGSSYYDLPATAGVESVPWFVERQGPGQPAATWIDPDGLTYDLMHIWDQGPGYFTMDGPAAWGSSPIELVTDPYPRGGEVVRYIRAQPRRVQWPLYVGGDSHQQFVNVYRTIMRAFTKTTYRRASGTLEVSRPDGTKRRINAFYEQGFEGEAGENWLWAKPTVQLFCPDGYWYDAAKYGDGWNGAQAVDPGTTSNFFTPFITLEKGSTYDDSDATTGRAIANPGDVEAWPIWTISGPIGGFECRNLTTGMRFGFTGTIPAGMTVTINSNPASVRTSTGLNWSRYIDWFNTAGTQLWPFAAGDNHVQVAPVDSSDGAPGSTISVAFQPRYETA